MILEELDYPEDLVLTPKPPFEDEPDYDEIAPVFRPKTQLHVDRAISDAVKKFHEIVNNFQEENETEEDISEKIKKANKSWEDYCVEVSKTFYKKKKIYGFDYFLRLFFAWWKHTSLCYLIWRQLKPDMDQTNIWEKVFQNLELDRCSKLGKKIAQNVNICPYKILEEKVIFSHISAPQTKKIYYEQKDLIIMSQDANKLEKLINSENNNLTPVIFFLDVNHVITRESFASHFIGGVFESEFSSKMKQSNAKEQYNLKTLIFLKDGMLKITPPNIGDCFDELIIDDFEDFLKEHFEKYKRHISGEKYFNGVNVAAKKIWCDIRDEPDHNTNQGGTVDSQSGSTDSQRVSVDGQSGSTDGQSGSIDSQRGSVDSQRGSVDSQREKVEDKIFRLYKKMCIASGSPYPNGSTLQEVLGYMLLRESLCVLSEHIRHTPARISYIFEKLRKTKEFNNCFDTISTSEPFFHQDTIKKLATILTQEEELILKGIEKVINNEINFDDLNDSSTKKIKIQKTFYEPQGLMVVLFIIFKYAADIIQIKEWDYFSEYDYDIEILIYIDLGFMVVFFIMSWFLRIVALRGAAFHIDLRMGKMILPLRLLIETIYVIVVISLLYYHINDPHFFLPSILGWYIPTRIAMVLGKIFLPMQPLTGTRKKWSIPKCPKFKRALGQVSFLIALVVTTSIYDYYLVVQYFDALFLSNYCGDPTYNANNFFFNFTQTNSQLLLCSVSLVRVAMVVIAALAISTGLFFIILMTILGGVIGCMKQGGSRSRIIVNKSELYNKIYERFHYYHLKKKKESEKVTFSKKIWEWCIKVWRDQSFISAEEAKNLISDAPLDIAKIRSHVGRDVIGFWISSLTIKPIKQLTTDQLPTTSIVIPVYSEKLEFKWEKKTSENPPDEALYLIHKFKYEYLNWLELMEGREMSIEEITQLLTDWLSERDQIVYRTVAGAVSYYDAVKFLCELEGKNSEEAEEIALRKVEVIVPYQKYQIEDTNRAILDRWLKKFPCLKVVFNYEAILGVQNVPVPLRPKLSHCKFATVCMHYDRIKNEFVYVVIPREYPLLIRTITEDKLQGKAMNQSNGMIYARGAYVQALDANQGAVATEYIKLPALLSVFKEYNRNDGRVSRPIIGCREYAFTKALSLVGSFHGHQEWSFVTIILRVFSQLGIRLHYGHPDVFWGPWARYACLSKINANINTSEDVFAGFYVLLSQEGSCEHVEHMQINKGKETGLFQMYGFDFKISQGNSALLRTRDIYHILERLSLQRGILFFYGIAGHFVTNTLMVMSLEWYIYVLVFYELSGVSLDQIGSTIFSTEWIIHAGCIAAIPLIIENIVEKGPVNGIVHSIGFIMVSTVAFLYQMLSKHSGFVEGMITGKAAHVDTGRGLDIYRKTMMRLFESYAFSHLFPITECIAVTILYFVSASELTGGTLPLIMIWLYIISIVISPQIFNPSLSNSNTLEDLPRDASQYFAWVGSPSGRYTFEEWEKNFENLKNLDDIPEFSLFCADRDLRLLPSYQSTSSLQIVIDFLSNFLFHLIFLGFWLFIAIFVMYPAIQLWTIFYLTVWTLLTIIQLIIFTSLFYCKVPTLAATTARVLIQIAELGFVIYGFVHFSIRRGLNFCDIYVGFFLFVKLLQNFRAIILMMIPLFFRSISKHENRKFHNLHYIILVNRLFQVNIFRSLIAIVWGFIATILAFLMRPTWSNKMMFGMTELTYDMHFKYNGQREHTIMNCTSNLITTIFKEKNKGSKYLPRKLTLGHAQPSSVNDSLPLINEDFGEELPLLLPKVDLVLGNYSSQDMRTINGHSGKRLTMTEMMTL